MPNKRIEDLTQATDIGTNDLFVVSQGSAAKRLPFGTLLSKFLPNEAISVTTLTNTSGLDNVKGSCVLSYYRKSNVVTISFNAKPNVVNVGVIICTLPIGYRPPCNIETKAGNTSILIRPDGQFRIQSTANDVNDMTTITYGV